MIEVSVFLPTRKGSERVINKNTRSFAGQKGGLLNIKLNQLLACHNIKEIILSTNDEASIAVGEKFKDSRLKIIQRPDHLALSSTNLIDLVQYVPLICESEHILWTHVTSPFTTTQIYNKAILNYIEKRKEGYDSLMSVRPFQNFLWSEETNDLVNRNSKLKWPRTQDLQKWYEIDSAIFLTSQSVYKLKSDRIGDRPFLFEQSGFSSFDVDWEDDFILAEMIYKMRQDDNN